MTYIAILRGTRGLEPALYHDHFEPNNYDKWRLVYACALPKNLEGLPLAALMHEYNRMAADGTLPPSLAKRR